MPSPSCPPGRPHQDTTPGAWPQARVRGPDGQRSLKPALTSELRGLAGCLRRPAALAFRSRQPGRRMTPTDRGSVPERPPSRAAPPRLWRTRPISNVIGPFGHHTRRAVPSPAGMRKDLRAGALRPSLGPGSGGPVRTRDHAGRTRATTGLTFHRPALRHRRTRAAYDSVPFQSKIRPPRTRNRSRSSCFGHVSPITSASHGHFPSRNPATPSVTHRSCSVPAPTTYPLLHSFSYATVHCRVSIASQLLPFAAVSRPSACSTRTTRTS